MADDEESMRGSNFEDNSSDDDSDEFVDAFDTIEPGMVTPKRRSSVAVPYNGPRPSRRGSLSASVFNLKDGLKKDDEEESESSEKPQPRTESFPSRNRTVESKAAPDDSESTKKNPNLSRQPTKPSDSDERDANLRQDLHKATEKLSKYVMTSRNYDATLTHLGSSSRTHQPRLLRLLRIPRLLSLKLLPSRRLQSRSSLASMFLPLSHSLALRFACLIPS